LAALAGIIITTTVIITADEPQHLNEARGSGPFFRARLLQLKHPASAHRKIWHRRRCCGIEKRAPLVARARPIFCRITSFQPEISLMRRSLLLAAATLVVSFSGAHAQAPMQRVQVGILECRGGSSVGFIVGSVTNLGCVLRVDGMPEDRYVATIRKVGVDLGITQESALAWGVYAPVARLGPGDLSGDYAGAQGSASVGVGVGGNVLVGGSANSIALQPLSVQGQVGLNVAAGLESLELRPGR
jgi:hypothetical protein